MTATPTQRTNGRFIACMGIEHITAQQGASHSSLAPRVAALEAATALIALLPNTDPARQNLDLAGDVALELAERFSAWLDATAA